MKEKWFDFIVSNKKYWANGFTLHRLKKVKPAVFADEHIMWDLLIRHKGNEQDPIEMMEKDPDNFKHCIGNFYCNILYKMMETEIIKNKK